MQNHTPFHLVKHEMKRSHYQIWKRRPRKCYFSFTFTILVFSSP